MSANNRCTDTAKKIRKLEQALIKAAFARYREWARKFGKPNPWGTEPNVASKKGWDMLMATKALYEAKRK